MTDRPDLVAAGLAAWPRDERGSPNQRFRPGWKSRRLDRAELRVLRPQDGQHEEPRRILMTPQSTMKASKSTRETTPSIAQPDYQADTRLQVTPSRA
jgi:hypothetical protein